MISIEGNIVNIDKTSRGRIEIGDDGLISSVGQEIGNADVLLKDELIFPGFIDLHVHARECADHSQDYKEDFVSAGQAAINGGVVAFADMPNNPVPPVDDKSYAEKYQLTKKSAADILLYAGIGPKTGPLSLSFRASASEPRNPLNIEDKGPLRSSSDAFGAGRDATAAVPYKVYMGKSVGDLFFESFEQLQSAISKYSGQSVSFHCEDPKILEANKNRPSHELQRPIEAEVSAVEFAIKLIQKYGLVGKICHVSTKEGLEKIAEAKKKGLNISCEVTPHHLYFDDTVIASAADLSAEALAKVEAISLKKEIASSDALLTMTRSFQVNPPIRQSKENRLALIAALKNGDIDYLATDHAPHSLEEKAKGMSGLTHLDTYGCFVTWLMKEHGFSPQDIARVCSYNPGNFLNNFTGTKYGKIAQGFAGSLSIINPNKPITIEKSMLKTKARSSPFEGFTFPGSVSYTIIKGTIFGSHQTP